MIQTGWKFINAVLSLNYKKTSKQGYYSITERFLNIVALVHITISYVKYHLLLKLTKPATSLTSHLMFFQLIGGAAQQQKFQ